MTDGRLPRWLSLLVIITLSALCWAGLLAILIGIMALIAIPIRAARRYGQPTFAAVTRVERSPAIASGAFLFVAAVTAATDRGKISAQLAWLVATRGNLAPLATAGLFFDARRQ